MCYVKHNTCITIPILLLYVSGREWKGCVYRARDRTWEHTILPFPFWDIRRIQHLPFPLYWKQKFKFTVSNNKTRANAFVPASNAVWQLEGQSPIIRQAGSNGDIDHHCHWHWRWNAFKHDWCHFRKYVTDFTAMPLQSGCCTGNWKKLSSSQAQLGKATFLAVA